MFTIAETEIFSAIWPNYWTPEEFGDFCAWLALNPEAGDVIPSSGGCRKVRWVVERCFSWLHGFRKLRFVTEKTQEMQFAFFNLALALICLRFL